LSFTHNAHSLPLIHGRRHRHPPNPVVRRVFFFLLPHILALSIPASNSFTVCVPRRVLIHFSPARHYSVIIIIIIILSPSPLSSFSPFLCPLSLSLFSLPPPLLALLHILSNVNVNPSLLWLLM